MLSIGNAQRLMSLWHSWLADLTSCKNEVSSSYMSHFCPGPAFFNEIGAIFL